MRQTTSLRRVAARLGATVAAAAVATIALPGIAQAHVSIQPGSAEGGGFSVVAFRVPNERDDASTTKLQVIMPEDKPVGSVQTTPIPGWKITTETRKLDKPIEMFGRQVDTVVSRVTWTATGDGLAPGQFLDFDLSLGPLPESGEMVFKALQTYSSGEQVNWNEVSVDDSVEPEHPAPTLALTAPADESGTAEQTSTDNETTPQSADTTPAAAETSEGSSDTTLANVLSAAALVIAVGAAILAWRRGRA